jgi:endonuclease/exonuclease/phosphatase family metal-dependent hydrolase
MDKIAYTVSQTLLYRQISILVSVFAISCIDIHLPSEQHITDASDSSNSTTLPRIQIENPCSDSEQEQKLHIVTWNIEWFPKNGRATLEYVTEIIQQLDIDVLAMQELDDKRVFDQMLLSLPNYTGYYESEWFAGLAYIYKRDVIEINDIYEIYTTAPYWNAFPRSPMIMDMAVDGEQYLLINNHFKCCGDGSLNMNDDDDEEKRRYDAINYLKEYIDTHLPNSKVLVLGDLNDNIADIPANNVFQHVLEQEDLYQFADMNIATGSYSDWSFPSWPSHLDHILVSNEIFPQLIDSNVYTIKIDDYLEHGFYDYDDNISDHRPVGLCLVTASNNQ